IGEFKSDITLHIGEVTGDYPLLTLAGKEVRRISPDGEIRDTFRKLKYVFDMPEMSFFKIYAEKSDHLSSHEYYEPCSNLLNV
ncbi:hypothetical protein, partial [Vibrio cholerae]|uniref:hypothetical protein n=1 Tax=Vibrio cholerae TaxID=666 RepID=UPI001F274195